jgi:tripartite ATP-independent transporter DctM subunit
MLEISPVILTLIMLGGLVVGVAIGYPLAFVIGSVAMVVGFTVWGGNVFEVLYPKFFQFLHNYTLLAAPLFVFMGLVLERTGITEKMYEALYLFFGGLRGGLALITVLLGTILAACVGIITASVTMLALVALPSMINRGYSKSLASGAVAAGGCLGILIPPSIMLVIYGPMASISVGKLFFAAILPGFLLSSLYMSYIILHSYFRPKVAPAVSHEELAGISFGRKVRKLLVAVAPTAILVSAVLGVIFFGVAPPTEAAATGAFATMILAIVYRKFNLQLLRDVTWKLIELLGFMFLLGGFSLAFTGVFVGAGCGKVVQAAILGVPGGQWGAFMVIMLIFLILGMLMDWIGIVFIIVPIITPIIPQIGFDPLWMAIMICVNLQMSFMTPPFAVAIFLIRGVAAPELGVTMPDVIRGVIPFVLIIAFSLWLLVLFPQIILWLPSIMLGY